jgi:uncharacterized membrane protein
MDQAVKLDELTRRTRRVEFEDGLNDLQNGLVFLLLGLLCAFFFSTAGITFYVRALVFYRDLTILALLALLALFVLITFGARRLIQSIRRKWIWKGRGRLVPLRVQVDWRVSLAATLVWLVLVVAGMVLLPRQSMDLDAGLRPMVAASGIVTGIVYFALGRSLQIGRYQWVGVLGGVLSAGLAFLPLTFAWSWPALAAVWATLLFVSGGQALRRTLQAARAQHD